MLKTKYKSGIFVAFLFCIVAFLLRIYQIFFITDAQSGLLTEKTSTSYMFYGAVFLTVIFTFFACQTKKFYDDGEDVNGGFKRDNFSSFSAVILGVCLLVRFVSESIVLFDKSGVYGTVERNLFFVVLFIWIFSLASSVYYFIIALSLRGNWYDFSKFSFFHIVPVVLIISRLFTQLINSVNAVFDVVSVERILFLIFAAIFVICFANYMDSLNYKKKKGLFFASFCLAFLGICCALSNAVFLISSKNFTIQSFWIFSDLALSLFAFSVGKRLLSE